MFAQVVVGNRRSRSADAERMPKARQPPPTCPIGSLLPPYWLPIGPSAPHDRPYPTYDRPYTTCYRIYVTYNKPNNKANPNKVTSFR